jgi:hypothetical protein
MELTPSQLALFRQPFEEVGALKGLSEEAIRVLLGEAAEVYVALAEENLRNKTNQHEKEDGDSGAHN